MAAAEHRREDRRRDLMVAGLLLVAVAIVGLGTGYLLSRAGSGSDGPRSAAPTTTGPTPSASVTTPAGPVARPTVRAASEVERGRTEDLGYLLGARTGDDRLLHVAFDRVQLLRGEPGARHARRTGQDPDQGRRGIVVNENPRTRDMVLAPDVTVLGGVELAASSDLEPVPVRRLLDAIDEEGGSLLLELRYDRLGYVVEVRERRVG